MKFKGTKGEWRRHQNTSGDIEISAKGFDKLAVVNFYPNGFRESYINGKLTGSPAPDSTQFRTECLYNARLISCAPELLDALISIVKEYDLDIVQGIDKLKITRLIEKATK